MHETLSPDAPSHPPPQAQRQIDAALAALAKRAIQAESGLDELRKQLDTALRRIDELERHCWAER